MVEKARTNSKSIISLTLGVLSIFIPILGIALGIIGVVFSRIGIKEIKSTNEDGKGLATAGLICSIVGIVIHVFWVLSAILSYYSMSNMEFELQFINCMQF